MSSQFWWYVTRSTGIVGYGLLSGSLAWGIAHSIRLFKRPRPAWMLDMHRYLSGLGCLFILTHIVVLLFDGYTHWRIVDLLVPFVSSWKPVATAIGVIAAYLLLLVECTSLAMKYLPRSLWRAIHFSSYALFVFATVHLVMAGTDTGNIAFQWFVLACCAVNVFLLVVRIVAPKPERPARATQSAV